MSFHHKPVLIARKRTYTEFVPEGKLSHSQEVIVE